MVEEEEDKKEMEAKVEGEQTTEAIVSPTVISDPQLLLEYGICKAPLPKELDISKWAKELSQVTPEILLGQDGEYAFYRNILEEPEFPFGDIFSSTSDVGRAILKHFPVEDLSEELQLDDAFCVHYNMDQDDTSGAKHMDPSDITINLCLEKSDDAKGSHVLFYGTKRLENGSSNKQQESSKKRVPETFLVRQDPGFATIHYGDHAHETTPLEDGRRTNVIMTYCYTDPTRSDVATRSCY